MAEAQELAEPQITIDQFDIWMRSPVTEVLIKCAKWKLEEEREHAGADSGPYVDSSNADLTHAMIHRSLGRRDAYRMVAYPEQLLEYFNMIEPPAPPELEEEETDE